MDSSRARARKRVIQYSPLESQENFHKLNSRFKGFSGPVGSGKSKALCYEAIRLSYLNAGRVGLIGAPTCGMLKDTTLTALLETLAEHRIPHRHHRAEQRIILGDNGSQILLRSLTNSDSLRGTNLAWFGVDELTYTSESSWLQLEARLRDTRATQYCGFAVWTPKGADWVYRRFIGGNSPNYAVVTAKPFENSFVLRSNPKYYDLLRNSYCDQQYRQEVLGEYITGDQNRVYNSFDESVHLTSARIDDNVPLLWAFDFNVDPMCSVVAQKGSAGVIVIDEIVLRRSGTEEMCREFANRYGDHRGSIRVYGDASGNSRSTKGPSDYDIVRNTLRRELGTAFALVVPRANPAVRDRVALVNGLLRAASGKVTLKVDPRCTELVKDFLELRFKEKSSIVDKDRDRERSHLSDALGYMLWQEYAEGRTLGEQNRRLI